MKRVTKQISRVIIGAVVMLLCLYPPITGEASVEETNGTVYYFSSTDGNDANDGLSPETPFQSLKKAEELSLKAGDALLLKRGDIWYGKVTLEVSKGSKEQPIVISAYGDEKAERPSLRYYTGYVREDVTENVLTLRNANGVEISDLMVGFANSGICFEYDTLNNQYLRITNCHFHDIYGVTQANGFFKTMPFSAGMYWRWAGEKSHAEIEAAGEYAVEDVYVEECTAYDAGSLTGYNEGVKNLHMSKCVAENNGCYGTVITARGGSMDRCVFNNNGTRPMPVGSTGIMISAVDFTITNSIISNQQRQGDDPDGCGIDFEWCSRNVTIDNCLFEGNAGVGIMFFTSGNNGNLGENPGTNYDCTVKNCKFVNNNRNIGNIGGYDIFAVNAGCGGCVVENNEYLMDDSTGCETIGFELLLGDNDCKMENNVQIDAVAEDYNPLDGNDDSDREAAGNKEDRDKSVSGIPSHLQYLLGLAEGIVIVAVVCVILMIVKRKRRGANE